MNPGGQTQKRRAERVHLRGQPRSSKSTSLEAEAAAGAGEGRGEWLLTGAGFPSGVTDGTFWNYTMVAVALHWESI